VIKQGVQLPYLKLSEQGVTSTEFKDAVLEIKATPHITSSGSVIIHMEVKKDQKSAQTGAGGEPGIDTRQAITDLLVEDGRTVVIGGIYEEVVTHNISGVPYFMEIPLIGRFFRNVSDKMEKTELLIFLTVTVVKNRPVT
jgi:type IV pilus assembly protein PilQ